MKMTSNADHLQELSEAGRTWLRGALSERQLAELDKFSRQGNQRIFTDIKALRPNGPVARAISGLLPDAFPTRMVMFNKSDGRNWAVPWHQDRVIAVREKVEAPGFHSWTRKAGQWHCVPPLPILEGMLFLRLHLDDDNEGNGPMQMALGSHKNGEIAQSDAERMAEACPVETCDGRRGDILVMHMLMLHRSRPATSPSHRRVLRVDYANTPLPSPLNWPA